MRAIAIYWVHRVLSGLHLWFRELLPQGPLERYLLRRHGLDPGDHFELLLALGGDLPGAVSVRPAIHRTPAGIAAPKTHAPAPPVDRLAPSFSLSGAQWKLSVRHGERGLVVPVAGETGIVVAKLHDPQHPGLVQSEHATLAWAKAAGVEIAETRMEDVAVLAGLPDGVPVGDGQMLLSRRFDREPYVHMEDFAQVLGRADQFRGTVEEVGVVLHALAPQDLRAFVERVVFCVISGNGDAHLKNWSIVYPDGRGARLSPAYDLVPTVGFLPNQQLVLPVGGEAEFARLTAAHFDGLAGLCNLPAATMHGWVSQAAARCRAAWQAGANAAFSDRVRDTIQAHMAGLALLA